MGAIRGMATVGVFFRHAMSSRFDKGLGCLVCLTHEPKGSRRREKMKKIYIHDDGSSTCIEHAPHSVKNLLQENPRKKIHWTPRGTWELAPASFAEEFKQGTGFDFDCETCAEKNSSAMV